jgi:site-specific recombinase
MIEPRPFSRGFWHFCHHILAYPHDGRATVLELHRQHQDKPFRRVTSRRAMRRLLRHWDDEQLG